VTCPEALGFSFLATRNTRVEVYGHRHYHELENVHATHSSFLRAKAVLSFVPTHLYDQTGLVLLYPTNGQVDTRKWEKADL
jgi:hypothetical protein